MKYIKLNHRVVGAIWDEHEQMWNIRIQKDDGTGEIIEDKANIFINASGVLKYFPISPPFPYILANGQQANGSGPTSPAARSLKAPCFIAQTGMTVLALRANVWA